MITCRFNSDLSRGFICACSFVLPANLDYVPNSKCWMKRSTCNFALQSWVTPVRYFPSIFLFLSYCEKGVISSQRYVIIYTASDNKLHSQHPHSIPAFPGCADGLIRSQVSNTPVRRHTQRHPFHGGSKPVTAPQWKPKLFSMVFKGAVPNLTLTCLSSVSSIIHTHKLPLEPGEMPYKPLTLTLILALLPPSSGAVLSALNTLSSLSVSACADIAFPWIPSHVLCHSIRIYFMLFCI